MKSVACSSSACEHIRHSLEKRGKGEGIRLSVKKNGCTGFGYVLEFVDDVNGEDATFSQDGFTLFVDKDSVSYLEGITIDYVKQGLNASFHFQNPNVTATCGCGESFSVDEKH